MAIFHLHAQYIGRSNGRSAVAASAYRSGSKLIEQSVDSGSGYVFEKTHDYRHKGGVLFSEVIVPDEHAEWMGNREELWNRIQNRFDIRKNSVFSHEKEIALPVELTLEQNLELLKDFVHEAFTKEGIIADVNVHYDNEENPHVHIMHSTREIVWNDRLGNSGEYTFGKKIRYWEGKEFLVNTRRLWAEKVNEHLQLHGFDKEISHLSYKELGIDLIPGIKEGAGRRIDNSDRSKMNDNVAKANRERILANPELIIDVLRRDRVVFTKEDISKALIDHIRDDLHGGGDILESHGASLGLPKVTDEMQSIGKYISALNKVLGSDRIVAIGGKDLEGKILYTSKSRYELEQDLGRVMNQLKTSQAQGFVPDHALGVSIDEIGAKGVMGKVIEHVSIKQGIVLSDKQKKVVLEVVNGGSVSVVEGLPGSGKTTVMKEVVRQYNKAGYEVMGSAVSSTASMELGERAGIDSFNITKFRYETEKLRGMIESHKDFNVNLKIDYYKDYFEGVSEEDRAKSLLSDKSVLIVDEASMVDLTQLHFVMSEVSRAGAKLILLGDRSQLSSVGIGGGLEKAADEYGISRLDEVRRQRDPNHRRATELLADYKVSDAIKIQKESGIFGIAPSIEEARARLVKDYVSDFSSSVNQAGYMNKSIMAFAYKNDDVDYLNASIRGKLKDEGVIYGREFSFEKSKGEVLLLAKGDRIVFDKNSSFLDVSNGDTGRIVGFGEKEDKHGARETVIVRLDREEKYMGVSTAIDVEVDNHFYKGLSYGFAITVNKSQGATYNSSYGLLTEHTGYNAYLVMCTRHIDTLKVYASAKEIEDVLFKRVDLDAEKARKEWNLYEEENGRGDIHYAGIAAIAYKRGDRSLSDDYKNERFDEPRGVVAEYLEVRAEALKLNNTIWKWLSAEKLKERYGKSEISKEKEAEFYKKQREGKIKEDKVWAGLDREHHPLYSELEGLIEGRTKVAKKIYSNSTEYTKILTQSNINFATVEKHALMSNFDFKLRKALPDGKVFGNYEDNKKLYDLLGSLEKLSKYEVAPLFDREGGLKEAELLRDKFHSLSGELLKSYEERRLDIEALSISQVKISNGISEREYKLMQAKEYSEVSIVKFFEKTYKEDHGIILDRWNSIKENNASMDVADKGEIDSTSKVSANILENSLDEVRKNPQTLGSLKGRGLGAALAFTPTRFRATVNLEVVADRLEKYEHAKHEIEEMTEWNKGAKVKHSNILKEIKNVKAGLVGSDLENFISDANKFAGTVAGHSDKDAHDSVLKNAIMWSKKPFNREKIGLFKEILDSSKQFKATDIDKEVKSTSSSISNIASKISFGDVVSKLGVVEHETLFRKYAPIVNSNDAIERKGNKIICGTINMDLQSGLWHRFSTGEGGNIFGLVREAEGCSKYESLLRVALDIGVSSNSSFVQNRIEKMPSKLFKPSVSQSAKNEWVAYGSIVKDAPLFKAEAHLKYMLKDNDIGAVHDYKDRNGDIIGHSIRVISKESGSKQVLPAAYCHNEALGKDSWRLKGFTDDKGGKPIYGLEKLYSDATKDRAVVIVEGEKTVDKAQELLPEYNVISWLGGSQNASKVDWSHLRGKDIAIWPDNDDVGIKCGKVIASNIKAFADKNTNVLVVNPNSLASKHQMEAGLLPTKWDLADELPSGLSLEDIKWAITNAIHEKDQKSHFIPGQFKSMDVARRIEVQQTYLCYSISMSELSNSISKHERLDSTLASNELKEYIKYTSTKGEFDSVHEFMNLDNKLYRESLISIGMSDPHIGTEKSESRPSEVLTKLEEKYQNRVQSFGDHLDMNKDYSKVLDAGGKGSGAKSDLFNKLSRDVMLLHKLQLEESLGKGNAVLSETHKEIVTSTIYDLVKEAKVSARGDVLMQEMQNIADKAYLKLCTSTFWSNLSDKSIEQVQESEFSKSKGEIILEEALGGIKEISGEERMLDVRQEILKMPESLRGDFITETFKEVLNKRFASTLEEISRNRQEGRDLGELVAATIEEHKLAEDLQVNHPISSALLQGHDLNTKLSMLVSNAATKDEMNDLMQEVESFNYFGLEADSEVLDKIKSLDSMASITANVRNQNINHIIWVASEDLSEIGKSGSVDIDGQLFTNPESYLDYKKEDQKFKQYLDETVIPDLAGELDDKFREKFKELETLDPDMEIGKLKARLCIPEDELREQIMLEALSEAFEDEIGDYLDGFKNAKEESSDIGELAEHISKEHEFVGMLFKDYPNAIEAFEEINYTKQITQTALVLEDNPNHIDNILMDVTNAERLGIKIEDEDFDELKGANSQEVGDKLFNICKDHALERLEDNLHEFKYEDHIEIDGMKFNNRLAYIHHEYHENNMDRYLEGTSYAKALHEMETHCLEHEISKEEYMEMHSDIDLDKGMSL